MLIRETHRLPAQPLTVSHPLGKDLKLGFWVNITNQFCQSYPSNVANIIVTYLRESTKKKKKTVWAVFERLS